MFHAIALYKSTFTYLFPTHFVRRCRSIDLLVSKATNVQINHCMYRITCIRTEKRRSFCSTYENNCCRLLF